MNDELKHYGILGMRWGVRRTPEQLSRDRHSRKKKDRSENEHEDYKKAHTSNSVKSMSDSELRSRINRLQMEKQYSQLTSKEKSAGAKFVSDVLREAAKNTASKYVSQYMSKGVESLIKSAMKR